VNVMPENLSKVLKEYEKFVNEWIGFNHEKRS
jgi:hypothetical protein